jgi:predicted glycosyltransferase
MITRGLNNVIYSLGDITEHITQCVSNKDNPSILEIGCGVGNALADLSELYPDVRLYGMNRKRYPNQIVKGNIYYLFGDAGIHIPIEDNSIEFAYSIHTLQFIEDKVGFLQEVHRVLKPNSELRIYIPETLTGIDGELISTVADNENVISLYTFLLSMNNPNISFYQHKSGLLSHNILRLRKITPSLDFPIQDKYEINDLGIQFPQKEGYKATYYKLNERMKLIDVKRKVLVIAASPHGYGHLYRGEMLSRFLSEKNFDVYYLSNKRVNNLPVNANNFSDLKINMESNHLDDDAKVELSKYFKNIEFEYVIIENFPLGKLFLYEGFKILHKYAKHKPKYICAFRDIFSIDDVIEIDRCTEVLNTYFDKLFVFSDDSFLKLSDMITKKIHIPIQYIGYLDNTYVPQITIFGGGGKYNYDFYYQTLDVICALNTTKLYDVKLFCGRTLPDENYQSLKMGFPNIVIERHSDDLLSEIAKSDITISTFGYNTFIQLLKFNNYNILVPLPKNHQEQYTRAQKFQQIKDKVNITLLDSHYKQSLHILLQHHLGKLINRNGLNNLLKELNNWK